MSPNSDEGTYTGVLFIYTYFVVTIKEISEEEKKGYVVIKYQLRNSVAVRGEKGRIYVEGDIQ